MAVFPDRIVLKNSTDSQAAIETAIGAGGTDQITQGEVVVGLEANSATFYTLNGNGDVVTIGSAGLGLGGLSDVDLTTAPPTNGQVIVYNDITGNWEPEDQSSGSVTLAGLDDVSVGIGGYSNGFEAGDPAYTLGSGSSLSTAVVHEGTNSIVCGGNNRPRVKFDTAAIDQSKRYDFWAYASYHDNAPGSTYGYVSLGGTWDGVNDGGYWLEWRTASITGVIHCPGATNQQLAESADNHNWNRDDWAHVHVLVDWGPNPTVPRSNTPNAVYVWKDGRPILYDTSIGGTIVPQAEAFFQFQADDKTGSSNTQYVDSVYFGQSDEWPFDNTASALAWESVVDYITSSAVDGQHIAYDSTKGVWVNVDPVNTISSLSDTNVPDAIDSEWANVSFLTKATQVDALKPAGLTGTWDRGGYNPEFTNYPSPISDGYLVSDTIGETILNISYGNSDTSFDLGGNDFTVEGYMSAAYSRAVIPIRKSNAWWIQADGPSNGGTPFIRFYWFVGGVQNSYVVAMPQEKLRRAGVWHHYAATRQGNTLRIFVDGVLCGSTTLTGTIDFGSGTHYAPYFAYEGFYGGARITKNVARYTSNFTPPTSWPEAGQSAADGDLLTYNATSQKWEAQPPSAAGIDNLTDVDTTTVAPTDGQALIWDNTASQWSPESISVESLSNYVPPTAAPSYYFTGTLDPLTPISDPNDYKGVDGAGANDYFAYLSTNTEAHALISIAQIGEAVTFTWDSGEVFTSTVNTVPAVNSGAEYFMRVTGFIFAGTIPTGPMTIAFPDRTAVDRDPASGEALVYGGSGWTPVALDIDSLSDVDTATTAPTDGQVLTWDNTNSRWEPADLQGAAIRTALGIGEYVDDAAAGTGGVASGAMYYNTTSSDYRLKT